MIFLFFSVVAIVYLDSGTWTLSCHIEGVGFSFTFLQMIETNKLKFFRVENE